MNKGLKVVLVGAVFALAGCFSSPISFVPSSSPVIAGKYTILANEVTGTNTQVDWLFFTFGKGGSGQRHALKDALRQVPNATALTAMAVDQETFILFPFVFPSFTTTRVTGTPVRANDNE